MGGMGPADQLAEIVAALRRAMRRAARAADPDNPLAVAQLELLVCVAEQPGVRPGQLARRLRLAPNSVTTLVNGVQSRGLITRSRSPEDARFVTLDLTPEGAKAVESWQVTNATIVQAALETLADDQQRSLLEALSALRELTLAIDAQAE
jgi:DNA-binding MarR family transcriptional regulator